MTVADSLDNQTFCGGRFLIRNHGLVYDRDCNPLYAVASVKLKFEDVTGRDSIVLHWYAGTTSTVQLDDELLQFSQQSVKNGAYIVDRTGICFSNLNGYRHRFGRLLARTCDDKGNDALVIDWDDDQTTIETVDKPTAGLA